MKKYFSLFISVLSSLSVCFLVISGLFFLNIIIDERIILVLFFSCFLVFYFGLKYVLFKGVKKMLDEFYSNKYNLKDKKSFESSNSLSKSIKKYALNKNLEIELLKEQENYRKEFIGNLAHELKTPLFTIQSYILTLIDSNENEEILIPYLKRSSKAVDRLIYLVKDLDLINQFESGTKNIELSSFNLIDIINNVFELLEIESKKINISLVLDKEYFKPIKVLADKDRIQQVITNLLINSIKYGVDNGTTEISIQDLNSEKFIIRITDNGLGIDKKHLSRLFERFYRVDKSGNRTKGGSGLGLSIVKHIIEAHQEKIYVESTQGIGSEFSFTLQKG